MKYRTRVLYDFRFSVMFPAYDVPQRNKRRGGIRIGIVAWFLFLCPFCLADRPLTSKSSVHFATVAEGQAILTKTDEFVARLSPFDRASRLQSDKAVSKKLYLDFVSQHVVEWSNEETTTVTTTIESLGKKLARFKLDLPNKIDLIKTTGREEGGAAYTRQNAIILPASKLKSPAKGLERLLAHELFHVLSRHDGKLRERLYNVIGFDKCGEIAFPREFKELKITNPDAPKNDHAIRVRVKDRELEVVPILFAKSPYDAKKGGRFFEYLQFRLLAIKRTKDGDVPQPLREDDRPLMFEPADVVGFFELVGRNTNYIIHPEEILADNFAGIVTERTEWRSPEVSQKITKILVKSE